MGCAHLGGKARRNHKIPKSAPMSKPAGGWLAQRPFLHATKRACGGVPGRFLGAHRDDAVTVLYSPVPGAQAHTLLPELGAHTGLRGKEHDVGEQAVCLPQGGLGWCQEVQVPVHGHTVHVLSRLWVRQHLCQEGQRLLGRAATESGPCMEGSGSSTGDLRNGQWDADN